MDIKAKAKYIKMSPSKVRLVVNSIRGADLERALNNLDFSQKLAAKPLKKLFNSARANAKNNFGISEDNLFVKEIRVDAAPTLKRWRPRAFGRAGAILKRSCHISVILGEKVESEMKKKKEKLEKAEIVESVSHSSKTFHKKEENNKVNKESGNKNEIFEPRSVGKHRHQDNLDKLRQKSVGGAMKRIFKRKSD